MDINIALKTIIRFFFTLSRSLTQNNPLLEIKFLKADYRYLIHKLIPYSIRMYFYHTYCAISNSRMYKTPG